MKYTIYQIIFRGICFTSFFLSITACKKNWLDAKPDNKLLVPKTLGDYQGILDNTTIFNTGDPALGQVGTDDYYTTFDNWQSASPYDHNAYVWASDLYEGFSLQSAVADWYNPYSQIFYANVVLDGLKELAATGSAAEYNAIKGSALFYRGFAYYNLAQHFAKPYNSGSAQSDPGVILRLQAGSENLHELSKRSTLKETYTQIISDLNSAISLLPLSVTYKTRPSRAAAYGALARTYLVMRDYDNAYLYADSCLKINSEILDFNSIDGNQVNPFQRLNKEVVFHSTLYSGYYLLSPVAAIIDTTLYKSYDDADLRKQLFFYDNGNIVFRGSYDQTDILFDGIATDEMYLIRAECLARKGTFDLALNDLNTLLIKRWATGQFVPVTASNSAEALKTILLERRKELILRGLRWSDLRRLNEDTQYQTILHRDLNGQSFTLNPNDKKYTLPIPDDEVKYSGVAQNPR